MRYVAALALVVCSFGCSKSRSVDAGPTIEPPIARSRLASPRQVSSGSAFDLVPIQGGALLVYGRPTRFGGGVQVLKLDEWGAAVGEDHLVFAPLNNGPGGGGDSIAEDALEIDADVARGSVAVTWVARRMLEVTQKAMFGDLATLRFGAPTLLGPTIRNAVQARGWSSVAASDDGRFHALVRLDDARCTDGSEGQCARFGHAEIRAAEVIPVGGDLLVPSVCPSPVSGIGWVDRRFHYAVCSGRSGQPTSTVYTIEPENSLARAEDVLPGCSDVGLFESEGEILALGRCAGGRAGARQPTTASAFRALSMGDVRVTCEGRTPIVTTAPAQGASIRLTRPTDRLDLILPETFVAPFARAVFTGKAVLVASPIGGEVALHRFDCDQGRFQQTDFM